MKVNVNKSNILMKPAPGQATPDISINIDQLLVENVDEFPYLGRIISNNVTCEIDYDNTIKAAHTAYGTLSHQIFNNHSLAIRTKIIVFRAVVLSTLQQNIELLNLINKLNNIKPTSEFAFEKITPILVLIFYKFELMPF